MNELRQNTLRVSHLGDVMIMIRCILHSPPRCNVYHRRLQLCGRRRLLSICISTVAFNLPVSVGALSKCCLMGIQKPISFQTNAEHSVVLQSFPPILLPHLIVLLLPLQRQQSTLLSKDALNPLTGSIGI